VTGERPASSAALDKTTIALLAGGVLLGLFLFGLTVMQLGVLPQRGDFPAYYSAGKALAEMGIPASTLYDPVIFREVMEAAIPSLRATDTVFWLYPPFFLLAVLPLGWLSLTQAFAAWGLLNMALTGCAARLAGAPLWFALALAFSPLSLLNVNLGQAGGFIALFMALGLRFLKSSPAVSGAGFSLLFFKPQFALIAPLALLARGDRNPLIWLFGGLLILVGLPALLLGPDIWLAFLQGARGTGEVMASGQVDYWLFNSVNGFLRGLGAPGWTALSVHFSIAALALLLCLRRWHQGRDGLAAPLLLGLGALLCYPGGWATDILILSYPFALTLQANGRSAIMLRRLFAIGFMVLPLAHILIGPMIGVSLFTPLLLLLLAFSAKQP